MGMHIHQWFRGSFNLVVASFLLCGCAGKSYQAYSGPPRTKDQTALLKLEGDKGWVGARTVDDTVVNLRGGDSIELLPGTHRIEFTPDQTVRLNEPYIKPVTVEAGKTYRAWAQQEGKQNFFQEMGGIPAKVNWRVNVDEVQETSK